MIQLDTNLALKLELAEAACGADCALFRARRDPTLGAVLEVGSGLAIYAGADSPVTQAFGLGMSGPVAEQEFECLEHFFESRQAAVQVEACPLADFSLTDGFCSRGYKPIEFSNVFGRDMSQAIDLPAPSAEVTVRPVLPGEEEAWADVASRGFSEGQENEALREAIADFSGHPNMKLYLALVYGEPAGAGTMSVRGEVAVVNGAATLPRFRRRGVHTELLRVRLEKARAAGCRLSMVATQVASGSHRNVERAGFCVLYTRTKWRKG